MTFDPRSFFAADYVEGRTKFLAAAEARGLRNEPVTLATSVGGRREGLVTRISTPTPNPFRGSTSVNFSLAARGSVDLGIYSVAGVRIRTLVSAELAAGEHTARWDGRDASGRPVGQGVFYARLRTADGSYSKTLTYLK
jgi:flagellar hook assembly protein FlgD